MPVARKTGLTCLALVLICGIAVAGNLALRRGGGLPDELRDIALVEPALIHAVALADAKGAVSFPDPVANRWTLLALGYTYCPDICPFMLGNLAELEAHMKDRLGKPDMPRFVFLSVDPSRDSTAHLAEYVSYFSDDFEGLTGPKNEIDRITSQLGAFYRLGPKNSDGDYGVDHSAEVFLIDPKGRLFGKFQPPLDPQETAEKFESARKFFDQSKT